MQGIFEIANIHFDDDEALDDDRNRDNNKYSADEESPKDKGQDCDPRYFLSAHAFMDQFDGIVERARKASPKIPTMAACILPKAVSETELTIDRDDGGSSRAEDSSTDLQASSTGEDRSSAAVIQAIKPDANKQSQPQDGLQGRNRAKTLEATHLQDVGVPATRNDLHGAAETSSQPDQKKSAL